MALGLARKQSRAREAQATPEMNEAVAVNDARRRLAELRQKHGAQALKLGKLKKEIAERIAAHRPDGSGWQYPLAERDADTQRLANLEDELNQLEFNRDLEQTFISECESKSARSVYNAALLELSNVSNEALPHARTALEALGVLLKELDALKTLHNQHVRIAIGNLRFSRQTLVSNGVCCAEVPATFPLSPDTLTQFVSRKLRTNVNGKIESRSIETCFPHIFPHVANVAPVDSEIPPTQPGDLFHRADGGGDDWA